MITTEHLTKMYPRRRGFHGTPKPALDQVSVHIQPGEVVGVVGSNGAGKSTFLKLLSRIVAPTSGRFKLGGTLASMLEVGTGFHQDLTGRENVFLNGRILGMRKPEIQAKLDEIVAFSGVEQVLDVPVKTYSSGMQMRLAFSVAAHLDADILLIDEVLAVGDAAFQEKCFQRLNELTHSQGRTIVLVSHQLGAITGHASRALCLDGGQLVDDGLPDEVVARYLDSLTARSTNVGLGARLDRQGKGAFTLQSLGMFGPGGEETDALMAGSDCTIRLTYTGRNDAPMLSPDIRVAILTATGTPLSLLSHVGSGENWAQLPSAGTLEISLPRLMLMPGRYRLRVQVRSRNEMEDFIDFAKVFDVVGGNPLAKGVGLTWKNPGVFMDQSWKIGPSGH